MTDPSRELSAKKLSSPQAMERRAQTVEDLFDLAAPETNPIVARLVPTAHESGAAASTAAPFSSVVGAIEFYAAGSGLAGGEDSAGVVKIGRAKDLPLGYRVDCTRLSGVHCDVKVAPSTHEVTFTDRSTNGTWLNGERMKKGVPVVLKKGDTISLLNPTGEDGMKYEYIFQQRLGGSEKPTTTEASAKMDDSTADALDEDLTCAVCRMIYHRPMSMLPCLHTFCAPCISGWLDKGSTQCPECRAELTQVRPNHKLASVIETITKAKPDLKRSATEIADLDKRNTLPISGKVVRKGKHDRDEDDDAEESDFEFDEGAAEDDDGSSEIGSDDSGLGFGAPPPGGFGGHVVPFGSGAIPAVGPSGTAFHLMPKFFHATGSKCAQCTEPAEDGFKCPPGQHHIGCFLCKTAYPDRPNCGIPQRCDLCNTPFCDLYLGGCKNPAGNGYLQPIGDHALDILPTGVLFGGNMVEQGILQRYLEKEGIAISTVWMHCAEKFKAKDWIPDITSVKGPLSLDSTLCRPCCQRIFSALLYHFRRSIPRDKLPPEVGARPDCWYGRECRTQHKNPSHAQNFNHICPQMKHKE